MNSGRQRLEKKFEVSLDSLEIQRILWPYNRSVLALCVKEVQPRRSGGGADCQVTRDEIYTRAYTTRKTQR